MTPPPSEPVYPWPGFGIGLSQGTLAPLGRTVLLLAGLAVGLGLVAWLGWRTLAPPRVGPQRPVTPALEADPSGEEEQASGSDDEGSEPDRPPVPPGASKAHHDPPVNAVREANGHASPGDEVPRGSEIEEG